MKLKYFLRGLGIGIIFGAIIMLAAYLTSGSYKLTDEEIISRAKNLGMVYESDIATSGDADNVKNTTEEVTTEAPTTEAPTTENTTEVTTEKVTEATTRATTESAKTTEDKKDAEYQTAEITVVGGMGSQQVAQLLEDAGMIESASDFDSYLNRNGYSTRIEIGTFEINSNMTYEEMATLLCTKQ